MLTKSDCMLLHTEHSYGRCRYLSVKENSRYSSYRLLITSVERSNLKQGVALSKISDLKQGQVVLARGAAQLWLCDLQRRHRVLWSGEERRDG